jgi:TonB-linked SusC/RagA family outer membrane protein
MLSRILSAATLLLMSASAWADAPVTLTGTVTDTQDEPLLGVIVADKANKKTASTDIDGHFTIVNPVKGCTFEVTYLGYNPKTIVWNGENPLKIQLEESAFALEETVVIGYGTVKKKDLTGSVGVVGADVLGQQRATQLSQGLMGSIPGLDVTRTSGNMPGHSATLQIRGVTSMSSSSPLILVDGTPVSSVDQVNPDDVEQLTVLKDAASASIYGARAAAGVILITTKGAKEGEVSINYNGEVSMIHATEFPEYVGPIEYMNMFNEMKWNDSGNGDSDNDRYSVYSKEYIENYYANNAIDPVTYPIYDWFGSMVKSTAMRHKHNLSLTYGNKVIKSRISASYENTDALYDGSNYERIFVRAKNTLTLNKYLSANVDLSMKHAVKNDPTAGSPIRAALVYSPIYMGLYPDGTIAPGQSGANKQAAEVAGGNKVAKTDYVTANLSLTWKPIDGLSITGTVTPVISHSKTKTVTNAIPYYDYYDPTVQIGYISGYNSNSLTEDRAEASSLTKSLVATYDRTFKDKHNLNVMVGYEDYTYTHESMSASTKDMELAGYPYLDNANMNSLSVSGDAYQNAYRSVFGRAMYNYDHRYFVQANIRGDASSRFHHDYRWGWFPSVSLGWSVSHEKFMEDVEPINNLMIRASLGTLGNERIGNYPYQASISTQGNAAVMYDANGNIISSTTASQVAYAVKDITWETTQTWDVGFDISLLNSRLSMTADYYYKKTKDMLLSVAIPSFLGYNNPSQNAGDMHTKGWEVKVGWNDRIGDWSYGASFNISDSKSVMGNLNGTITYSGDCIIREGDEYMAWYGYRSDGLWQTDPTSDDAVYISGTKAGDVKYKDLDNDGQITASGDREVLGSSLPHFIFGGNLNAGWKDLSLSIGFNGVGKQTVQMTSAMQYPADTQWYAAPANILGHYWSLYNTAEQNAAATYPRLSNGSSKSNYLASDFWLINGAYMRIKSINLSYNLPKAWMKKVSLNSLRVYFNVDDPFCFDHYMKGWDPETNSNNSAYIATTYTFGIDLKF